MLGLDFGDCSSGHLSKCSTNICKRLSQVYLWHPIGGYFIWGAWHTLLIGLDDRLGDKV